MVREISQTYFSELEEYGVNVSERAEELINTFRKKGKELISLYY